MLILCFVRDCGLSPAHAYSSDKGGLNLKIGDRVFVSLPEGNRTEVCKIIEGPLAKGGVACFKVQHEGYENWYPVDWMKPHISLVAKER